MFLVEYMHVRFDELWEPIKKGLDQTWDSFKLALKDVLGAIVYTLKVTLTFDDAKLQAIREKRSVKIKANAKEYSELFDRFVSANEDFSTIAFIAAPFPYLAAKMTAKGPASFFKTKEEMSEWFSEIGYEKSNSSDDEENKRPSGDEKENGTSTILQDIESGRARSHSRVDVASMLVMSHQKTLAQLLGIDPPESSTSEGVRMIRHMLFEESKKNINIDFLNDKNFKAALSAKIDSKKIVEEKKRQLEEIVATLSAPYEFLEKVKNSKSVGEIQEAYEALSKSFLQIKGLDTGNPTKSIEAYVSKKVPEVMADKKKIEKVLKAAGIKVDKKKLEDKKALQKLVAGGLMRMQTVAETENIKKVLDDAKFEKKLEEEKANFIKSFMDGIDERTLEQIKKIDSSNEYAKLLSDGVQKIRSIGLRK